MRKVRISNNVWKKFDELADYLSDEYKLSEYTVMKRIDKMLVFLLSLSAPADYALCRFKRWRTLGYRCVVFEKRWIFAYEDFEGGIIVQDMAHVAILSE